MVIVIYDHTLLFDVYLQVIEQVYLLRLFTKTGISALSTKRNHSNSPVRLSDPNSCSNPSSKGGSGNKNNNDDADNNHKDLTPQISPCDSDSDHDKKESDYDDSASPTQRYDSVCETSTKGNFGESAQESMNPFNMNITAVCV